MDFPSRDYALGWLAGMIDGEGTVSTRPLRQRHVKIGSTDQELVDALIEVLDMLEVSYRLEVRQYDNPKWRTMTNVIVGHREGIETLAETMRLRHRLKEEKLRGLPATYTSTRLSRDELVSLYVEQGLSQAETARRMGVPTGYVRNALVRHGLLRPTPPQWKRPVDPTLRRRRSASARAAWERRRAAHPEFVGRRPPPET
jgi:hypothetical protein